MTDYRKIASNYGIANLNLDAKKVWIEEKLEKHDFDISEIGKFNELLDLYAYVVGLIKRREWLKHALRPTR